MKAIDRLYEYLDFKGMKATPFEAKAGLSNGYLGKQLKRNADLGESILLKIIENCLDLNPLWLLQGSGPMLNTVAPNEDGSKDTKPVHDLSLKTDVFQSEQVVPLYNLQESGAALFRELQQQEPIDYIRIPNLAKCDGAVYVNGDSMYPVIKGRDVVLFKKIKNSFDNIFWGEMYLIVLINDFGDEFVMVKSIQKSALGDDHIKLVSENSHYEPKEYPFKNVKGLALIKAVISMNSMI